MTVILHELTLSSKATIDTGNGSDTVGMFDSTVCKDLTIKTGNGSDNVGTGDGGGDDGQFVHQHRQR